MNYKYSRPFTCKLLDLAAEEAVDVNVVLAACLSYMSESEVEDMMRVNDIITDDEFLDEYLQ